MFFTIHYGFGGAHQRQFTSNSFCILLVYEPMIDTQQMVAKII